MTAGRRSTVVLLDHSYWQAFADLAGALRERGLRVERITARSSTWRERAIELLERPLFSRVTHFEGARRGPGVVPHRVHDLIPLVSPDAIDLVTQDDLLAACLPIDSGMLAPSRRLAPGVDPRVLVDKWRQGETARAAGVDVPVSWETPSSDSFPVVVKARLGFGGSGVRIVHDEEQLARAWVELTTDGVPPFLQGFHTGAVNTGGVALRGEVLVAAAYRPVPNPDRPTAPPQWVTLVDRPDALEAAARYLGAIGFTGFFCIDWVLDSDDRPLLIDVNPRPFGSWTMVQELGVDLLGAYLHVLGLGERPEPQPLDFGASSSQLVFPCPRPESPEDVRRWRRESLDVIQARGQWLGRRWRSAMRARVELGATRSRLARALGQRGGAGQGRISVQADDRRGSAA